MDDGWWTKCPYSTPVSVECQFFFSRTASTTYPLTWMVVNWMKHWGQKKIYLANANLNVSGCVPIDAGRHLDGKNQHHVKIENRTSSGFVLGTKCICRWIPSCSGPQSLAFNSLRALFYLFWCLILTFFNLTFCFQFSFVVSSALSQ